MFTHPSTAGLAGTAPGMTKKSTMVEQFSHSAFALADPDLRLFSRTRLSRG